MNDTNSERLRSRSPSGGRTLDGIQARSSQLAGTDTQKAQINQTQNQPSTGRARARSADRDRANLVPFDLEVGASKVKDSQNWWYQLKNWFSSKRAVSASLAALLVVAGVGAWWFSLSGQVFVQNDDQSALALEGEVDPTRLKGEGDGRINLLLIGTGGEEHKSGSLADSIMLVSIDPFAKEAAMLSVPRDMYVNIPSFGYSKVNAAHAYGEQYDYEGGGPGLLKDTLETTLDIPIHYFVRLDFEGFKQAINRVGGLEIKVEEDIHDHSFPDSQLTGFEPFHLEQGVHQFDGETALKYARSRYSTSDFDRSRRQQKILTAFREKVLSLGTVTNPVTVGNLLREAGRHVRTDLKPEEILKLAEIGRSIESDSIIEARLDNSEDSYLKTRHVGGSYALVPRTGDFEQIQNYVHSIFVDGYIRKEGATITVLNGTKRPGLAGKTQQTLEEYNYKVKKIANAENQDYQQTQIYDYSQGDNPYTVRYLEERFNVSSQRRLPNDSDKKQHGNADIVIILGNDYQPED